jgi:hypothetical protein
MNRKPSVALIHSSGYRSHNRYMGVTGHYLLFERGGTRISDISGYRNNATLTNSSLASAWITAARSRRIQGIAVKLDGTNDYISVPFTSRVNFKVAHTTSIWMYVDNSAAGFQTVLSQNDTQYLFFYLGSTSKRIAVYINGTANVLLSAVNSITDKTWHHIVITYNGTTWTLYIDGTSRSTSTNIPPTTLSTEIRIGYRTANVQALAGSIFDVRFFNRALPPRAVRSLFNNPYLEFEDFRPFMQFVPAVAAGVSDRLLRGHGI